MKDWLKILQCPSCKQGSLLQISSDCLQCLYCRETYPISNGVACLIDTKSYNKDQKQMSEWWDDLCLQWYSEFDKTLTTEKLYGLFDELEASCRDENHLIFSMDLLNLKDKDVLDIGCGGGIHDALFRKYGANVCAIDISEARVFSANLKMSLVRGGGLGFAAQANGENLPFKNESFDIIYSNGVMHHSESTEKMIEEAYGALKPGGKIVMMLYAKNSIQYFIHLIYHSFILGYYFRFGPKYWLGACTEGKPKFSSVKNPFTRAFTKKEVYSLLSMFTNIKITKQGFDIGSIPFFGRRLRPLFCKICGLKLYKDVAILRVGAPFYGGWLPFEKKLGKYLGWSLNITAYKPL